MSKANNADNKKGVNISFIEKPSAKSEQTNSDDTLKQNASTKKSNDVKIKNSNDIGTANEEEKSSSVSIFSSRDQTILLVVFIAFTLIIWSIAPFQAQNNPNDVQYAQ